MQKKAEDKDIIYAKMKTPSQKMQSSQNLISYQHGQTAPQNQVLKSVKMGRNPLSQIAADDAVASYIYHNLGLLHKQCNTR